MPTSPEEAVRRYLDFLKDPSSAIDAEAVKAAESRVEKAVKASDRLEELEARAELLRTSQVNEILIEQGFTEAAKDYANEKSIPAAHSVRWACLQMCCAELAFSKQLLGVQRAQEAVPAGESGSKQSRST